jgi:hypothetical protein
MAALIGIGTARVITGAKSVHAQSAPSVASIKGAWGFNLQGMAGGGSSISPVAAGGQVIADGAGNLSGTETYQAYGAGLFNRTFSGTYTVNPDGTGAMTLNFVDEGAGLVLTNTFRFVLVGNSLTLRAVQTDPGLFATAEFQQQ